MDAKSAIHTLINNCRPGVHTIDRLVLVLLLEADGRRVKMSDLEREAGCSHSLLAKSLKRLKKCGAILPADTKRRSKTGDTGTVYEVNLDAVTL